MIEMLRDLLTLFEEINSASVFATVMITLTAFAMALRFAYKFYNKIARRCGVQKSLLIGYVQSTDGITPSEAIQRVREMTDDMLRNPSG